MTVYFVSRHPGAREWAEARGLEVDEWVSHLDLDCLRPGDQVVGSLPVNLAAEVCAMGAEYWHLSLDLGPADRGRELSREELKRLRPRLEQYRVDLLRMDPTGLLPGL